VRVPQRPPVIAPVKDGVQRPVWSVMIPVYNCSQYIKETLEAVLGQDPGPDKMQIEVVDDCSTDADVAQLVMQIGKGRIDYYCQPVNVGSLRNFETCLNRSRGEYIHLMHGDDKVKNGFYAELEKLFQMFPEAGAAFCAHDHIDMNGQLRFTKQRETDKPAILKNWLPLLAEAQRIQYIAMVVKRSVYEHLGGFYGVVYGEDWEMWARIAKHYPIAYTPKNLAQYREHELSISNDSFITGRNLKDIKIVIEIIMTYLPPEDRKRIKRRAEKIFAYYSLNRRKYLWLQNKEIQPRYIYFYNLWKMHIDFKLLMKSIKFMVRMKIYNLRKMVREHKLLQYQ
jgi:glycosyltransferase involved in cell wall biosynthesis